MEYIFITIHFMGTILLTYKIKQLFGIMGKIQRREQVLDSQVSRLLNKITDLEAREASLENKEYSYEAYTNKELRELKNDINKFKFIINRLKI